MAWALPGEPSWASMILSTNNYHYLLPPAPCRIVLRPLRLAPLDLESDAQLVPIRLHPGNLVLQSMITEILYMVDWMKNDMNRLRLWCLEHPTKIVNSSKR